MKKKVTKRGIAVLVWIALSGAAAQAAIHYYFLPADGNWADPANWDLGEVPGASTNDTYAQIQGSCAATINVTVPTINRFQLGAASQTGTLNIMDGASLYLIGGPDVGNGNSSAGFLNINGGHLKCGSAGQNEIKVGVDSAGKSVAGKLVIRGGTVESQFIIGSTGVDGAAADTMRIEGNAATVFSTASQTSGSGLTLGSSATLEFIFGRTGISCLTFNNADASFSAGSKIIVDGAAYAGGARTYTLIDATVFTNGTPTITVTNFGPKTIYSWNATNGTFTVTVVPKPSGLLVTINAVEPYVIPDSFIAYIKSATNPDLLGLRDDGRFYPYSPPGGRRIAYRQQVVDNSLYLQGWSPQEAEQQLRRELEAVVAQLRGIVLQKTGRNFDGLSSDSQELLLDFAYSEGTAFLSDVFIRAAVAQDWTVLLDPVVYSRNEADWPDACRNKAYFTRWRAKGGL